MLFFSNEQEVKTVTSALRRELKALGLDAPSHNQMLEAVAKSFGHKSYAAMLAAQPQVAPTAPPALKPVVATPAKGKYDGYELRNTRGELDLSTSGALVTGLWFNLATGTSDDIPQCTAGISGASRNADGTLDFDHDGGTDVNWDGQFTRKNSRGVQLLCDESADEHPADCYILVPENWGDSVGFDEDSSINLLSQEVVEEYDLRVRDVLVAACLKWLVDKGQVAAALEELDYDEDFGGFTDDFAHYADAVAEPGTKRVSVLGAAQWVAGFRMHVGEFASLREQLLLVA